jgi:hypothetical protein
MTPGDSITTIKALIERRPLGRKIQGSRMPKPGKLPSQLFWAISLFTSQAGRTRVPPTVLTTFEGKNPSGGVHPKKSTRARLGRRNFGSGEAAHLP